MPRFFKNNPALAAGIALPLLLIIIFFVAGKLVQLNVADPQYDALIAANYYHYADYPYSFEVQDGDILLRYQGSENQDKRNLTQPELYRFDHDSFTVSAVAIDFEEEALSPEFIALNSHTIIDDPVSPDGYRLERDYHSGGIFNDFFGFGGDRNLYLQKDGRRIAIDVPAYGYNTRLIGWVINE